MLVTKEDGTAYAVVQTVQQKEILETGFCSRWATHCLNVKLKELNNESKKTYDRKWFVTKKSTSITQVGVIAQSHEIEILKGVQIFDTESLAQEKKKDFLKKHNEADIVKLKLYTNVTKSEQKKLKKLDKC